MKPLFVTGLDAHINNSGRRGVKNSHLGDREVSLCRCRRADVSAWTKPKPKYKRPKLGEAEVEAEARC